MHYTQVLYKTAINDTIRLHMSLIEDIIIKVYLFFKGQLITANVCVNQNIFDWPSILKSKYSTQLLLMS